MKSKIQLSSDKIASYLPEPPEGFLGYDVDQMSHMWYRIWLEHPPYTYKEGVRTIWGFVKSTGKVYQPFSSSRARPDIVCELHQLFKQNPYSLIKPKDLGYSLLSLL